MGLSLSAWDVFVWAKQHAVTATILSSYLLGPHARNPSRFILFRTNSVLLTSYLPLPYPTMHNLFSGTGFSQFTVLESAQKVKSALDERNFIFKPTRA